MDRSNWKLYASALGLGVLLVPARFVLMFFPGFNVGEVVLFGGAAAALAYVFAAKPAAWSVLLFLPTFLLVLRIVVSWLGADNIGRGVGTSHALSLVLIPLSTFAGAYYGDKARRRTPPARETLTSRPTF